MNTKTAVIYIIVIAVGVTVGGVLMHYVSAKMGITPAGPAVNP